MSLPESNGRIVLISGVNGYIASQTAKAFLDAGYSVRGTVRNLSSGENLLQVLEVFVQVGRFEIVEVKDITVNGAFDKAVKGMLENVRAIRTFRDSKEV